MENCPAPAAPILHNDIRHKTTNKPIRIDLPVCRFFCS